MTRIDHGELLDAVYEAAALPETWPVALRRLALYCDSEDGNLTVWNNARDTFEFCASVPSGAQIWKDYTEYFHLIDPRRKVLSALPANRAHCCNDFFGDGYVSKSEYYQDLLIPNGMRYTMGGRLNCDNPAEEAYVYVFRNPGGRPYDQRDREKFQSVLGHLQRAFHLHFKARSLRDDAFLGRSALDKLSLATFIVDLKGYLLLSNQSGQSLLDSERPFVCANGKFLIRDRLWQARIQQTIEDAIQRQSRRALHATFSDGSNAYLVLTPMERGGGLSPTVMLTVSDIDHQPVASSEALVSMFGLSQAEIRLTQALLRGSVPAEYATHAGISLPTVRGHLRSILAKTGARRQTDLIRLLSLLPPE
jgi:DNA-binding CsgD family transcriptional regulator